jgi:WD40 repeat protein
MHRVLGCPRTTMVATASHTVHGGRRNGAPVVAYATADERVVVTCERLRVRQCWRESDGIAALSVASTTGAVCVASKRKNRIAVYAAPDDDDDAMTWQLVASFSGDENSSFLAPISAIACSATARVVCVADAEQMHICVLIPRKIDNLSQIARRSAIRFDAVVAHSVPIAAPLRALAVAPDDKFVAAFAENDRIVKLWFVERGPDADGDVEELVDVLLLPHPAPLRSVDWRRARRPLFESVERLRGRRNVVHRNFLLTLAHDGVARLWLESPLNEVLQFGLTFVIPLAGTPSGCFAAWIDCSVATTDDEAATALHERYEALRSRGIDIKEPRESGVDNESDDDHDDHDHVLSLQPHLHLLDAQSLGTVVDDAVDARIDAMRDSDWLLLCSSDGFLVLDAVEGADNGRSDISVTQWVRASLSGMQRPVPTTLALSSSPLAFSARLVRKPLLRDGAATDAMRLPYAVSLVLPCGVNGVRAQELLLEERGSLPVMIDTGFQNSHVQSDAVVQVARHTTAPLVATCDAAQVRLWRVHSSGDLRAFGTGCLPSSMSPVARVAWHHTLTVLLVVHTDDSVSLVHVDSAKSAVTLLGHSTLLVPEAPPVVESAKSESSDDEGDLGAFLGRNAKPTPKKKAFDDNDDDGDDALGSFLARPKVTVTAAPSRSLDDNNDDDDALGSYLARPKGGAPKEVPVAEPEPAAQAPPAPRLIPSRPAKLGDVGLLGSSLTSIYVCGTEINGTDLLLWRAEGGTAMFRQPMNGAVTALSCSGTDRVWVALGTEIECWSVSTGAMMSATRLLRSVQGDEAGGSIRQLVPSPSGDLLLTSSDDGAVVVWRPRVDDVSVQMVRTIAASRASTVRRLASSSVAVSTAKRTVTEVTKRSTSTPPVASGRANGLPLVVVAAWLGDRALALLRDVSTDSVVGVQSERVVDIFNWCSVAKRRVVRIQPEFRLVERLPASEWTRAVSWVHESGSLLVGTEFGQLDLHPADRLPDNLRTATAPAVELALKSVDRARLAGLLAEQCSAVPVYHPAQLVELVLGGRSATIGALLAHVSSEAASVVERLGAVARSNECPITVRDVDWFDVLGHDTTAAAPANAAAAGAAASSSTADAGGLDLGTFGIAKPSATRAPQSRGDFLNTLDDTFGDTASMFGRKQDSDDDDDDDDDSGDSDDTDIDDDAVTASLAPAIAAGEAVLSADNFGFGSDQATSLVEILSQRVLYGLTSGQQLDFLALGSAFVGTARVRRALDDCAIRFATAARFFEATTLHGSRTSQLPASTMAWAVLSEARAPLLEYFFPSPNVEWAQCRALGVGLWLRDMTPLRELMERVAGTQFAINQKPGDAALFYIALKKRSALAALYQSVGDKRLAEFFSHDFEGSERWQAAAVKNAFVLLSQQRFELAASMFALGGSLRDMVRVLIDKLHDFQLALAVCRLLEPPGGPVLPAILRDVVVPLARETSNPALALMAHWLLGEREQAVAALVPKYRVGGGGGGGGDDAPKPAVSFSLMRSYQRTVQERTDLITSSQSVSSSESTDESRTLTLPETLVFASEALGSLQFDPSLVHLYQYLANHPLLRGLVTDDRRMRMLAADAYVECGCLLLAVEQLDHLQGVADVAKLRRRCAARLLEEAADELALRSLLHDVTQRDATRKALLARRAIALHVLEGDTAALEAVIVSPQTRLPATARLVLFEELRADAPLPSAALLARQSGVLQRACALLTESAAHLGSGVAPPPSALAEVLDLFDTLRRIIDRLHAVAVGEEDERRLLASQPLITCVLVIARTVLFWSALDRGDAALHCALMANVSEGELCALLEETLSVAHTDAQARRVALVDAFLDALHDNKHLAAQCQSLLCKASDELFGSAPMLFGGASGTAREDADEFDEETRACLLTSLNVLLMQRAGALLSDVAAALGETPVAAAAAAAAAADAVGDGAMLHSAVLEVAALVSQASRRCIDASWTLVRVLDRPPAAFLAQCEARVADIARSGLGGRVSQTPFAAANAASASTPVLLSLVACKAPHDLGRHMLAEPTAAAVDLAWRTVATVARFAWRALLWPRAAERVRLRMATSPDRLLLHRGGPAIDVTPARLSPAAAAVASRATIAASAGGLYPTGASPIDLFDVRALAASLTLRALQRGLGAWRCDPDAAVVHDAKDLVLALCVNECDSQYIAIATAAGVFDAYVHEENLFTRRGAQAPGIDLRASTLSPERRVDNAVVLAMTLASHPTQPFYVSGGADGGVLLWQWNTTRALLTFRKSASTRVMRVRFTPTGSRLAAVDSNGDVLLWCFRTSMAGNAVAEPYLTLRCDARGATDLVFLDNGRLFATAGLSDSAGIDDVDAGDATATATTTAAAAAATATPVAASEGAEALGSGCVRVWDSLRGGCASCCVMQFGAVHNEAASALCVSHRHELLISGGKRGELATWRLRDGQMRTVIAAHTLNVKSLALDRRETILVSGSTDGSVRTWSMPALEPLQVFENAHEKRTFVRATRGVFRNAVSTYGVMHVAISDDEWLLTCGSDGRVCLRRVAFGNDNIVVRR